MNQLSFPAEAMQRAQARAQSGIERSAGATERRVDGWCELAVERLRGFVRNQAPDTFFTIEIARSVIAKDLPAPHDLRSWGKVTRMAIKRGYIEKVPRMAFPAVSSNGSMKPVWKAGEGAAK